MATIEGFAADLIARYAANLTPVAADFAVTPFQAGEWECAAISIIEDAPSTTADVDELERLAADFDPTNKKVAQLVIAKKRAVGGG